MMGFTTTKIKNIMRNFRDFISYYSHVLFYRHFDYFQYKTISHPFHLYSRNKELGIRGNLCFGNINAVKNALGPKFVKTCMIEHGLYFGRAILHNECEIKGITTIYTFGPYRAESLYNYYQGNLGKTVISVGPYIKYVKNYYGQEKLKALKKKYGRILLVFPSHPDPENDVHFIVNDLVEEIERIKADFDTVFVSMFWLDIRRGKYKEYLKHGYIIVSSGHRFDPMFLSRQKDLIELSDYTMSNDIGTHIGYCIALNKPHYLFKQKILTENICLPNGTIRREHDIFTEKEKELNLITDAFKTYSNTITKEQKHIVNYFWGSKIENEIRI